MRKKLLIPLSCIALAGITSVSALAVYSRNNDKSAIKASNEDIDYEAVLSPYQDLLDEFNSSHGTTYGFMTDEQLALHHMDKDEYLKNAANEYSGMTEKEFIGILEKAYANDHKISADNLPYYQEEPQSGTVEIQVQNPDPNGGNFVFLDVNE